MGVWVTPYAMPKEDHNLTHDEFVMLIVRALHEGYGHLPITIASGLIAPMFHLPQGAISYLARVDAPQDIAIFPHEMAVARYNDAGEPNGEYGRATLWYRGDEREAIVRALNSLPYGIEDIWVDLGGNWDDPEFYALTESRTICFGNAWVMDQATYATAAYACQLAGEKGREPSVYDYTIGSLLAEYFGPEMRVCYTYS